MLSTEVILPGAKADPPPFSTPALPQEKEKAKEKALPVRARAVRGRDEPRGHRARTGSPSHR